MCPVTDSFRRPTRGKDLVGSGMRREALLILVTTVALVLSLAAGFAVGRAERGHRSEGFAPWQHASPEPGDARSTALVVKP